MKRPAPVLGLRRRHRVSGEPFMTTIIDEQIVLEPGDELHLRRLHNGNLETPEFALVILRATATPTKHQLKRAAADRLDGSALRNDPRHCDEVMP